MKKCSRGREVLLENMRALDYLKIEMACALLAHMKVGRLKKSCLQTPPETSETGREEERQLDRKRESNKPLHTCSKSAYAGQQSSRVRSGERKTKFHDDGV